MERHSAPPPRPSSNGAAFVVTPPPRPTRVLDDQPVNERPVRTRMRWDTMLTVAAAAAIGFAVGVAVATPIILGALPAHGDTPVNEDPAGSTSVPQCTDEIADAGGICIGEPVPVATPSASPVNEDPGSGEVAEVTPVAPPLVAAPVSPPATDQTVPITGWRLPDLLPTCRVADDDGCFYPGRALGDRCDWINSPELMTTWFFNCDDPKLNGRVGQ